jgi:hypothetical protein
MKHQGDDGLGVVERHWCYIAALDRSLAASAPTPFASFDSRSSAFQAPIGVVGVESQVAAVESQVVVVATQVVVFESQVVSQLVVAYTSPMISLPAFLQTD